MDWLVGAKFLADALQVLNGGLVSADDCSGVAGSDVNDGEGDDTDDGDYGYGG